MIPLEALPAAGRRGRSLEHQRDIHSLIYYNNSQAEPLRMCERDLPLTG